MAVGADLRPEILVEIMMQSKGNWEAITDFITTVQKKKEKEERT